MTLKQWADNAWLKSHKTSAEEIGNLLAIVEPDLRDSIEGGISADGGLGLPTMQLSSSVPFFFMLKVIRRNERYSTIVLFKRSP